MGSLSYELRGNLSIFTGIYYSGFMAYNKEINAFREVISSEICPFCPVILGYRLHNPLANLGIRMSDSLDPDILIKDEE